MVFLLLADGFEDMEAVAPIDILRRAEIPLCVVGVTGKQVTSKHGLVVQTDILLADIDATEIEMLVLPGGPGVARLKENPDVFVLVTETALSGKPIGAICAAPGLLAEWGLLRGRQAVCFPSCESSLTQNGALLDTCRQVVVDPPYVTAKSAGVSMEFALELVALLRGRSATETVFRDIHP